MSHWSHVGMVDHNKQIVGMSTNGVSVSDVFSLDDPNIDIGLYRHVFNDGIGEEYKKLAGIYLEISKKQKTKYNWLLLLKMYLRERWRVQFLKFKPTEISIRGLINAYAYELIDYI